MENPYPKEPEPLDRSALIRSLSQLSRINAQRGNRFHVGGMEEWTILEWSGAMCGEAGEAANACKKLRRMQLGGSHLKNNYATVDMALLKIAEEVAGTFLYLDLLCTRAGISLPQAIIAEFNRVSEREGFPERF